MQLPIVILFAVIATCSARNLESTSSSNPLAITKAQNLLKSIADTLNGRSAEKVDQYVDNGFIYRGCSTNFDKKTSLELLESYPTKGRFSHKVIEARFVGDNLVYKVSIAGFGPKFTALYKASLSTSLRGKYILMTGEELSCPKVVKS